MGKVGLEPWTYYAIIENVFIVIKNMFHTTEKFFINNPKPI